MSYTTIFKLVALFNLTFKPQADMDPSAVTVTYAALSRSALSRRRESLAAPRPLLRLRLAGLEL